jgi:hypothetical protein
LAALGAAFTENVDDGTIVKAVGALALLPFTITEGTPVVAPAGTMNFRLVALSLEANPVRVPPPCLSRVN